MSHFSDILGIISKLKDCNVVGNKNRCTILIDFCKSFEEEFKILQDKPGNELNLDEIHQLGITIVNCLKFVEKYGQSNIFSYVFLFKQINTEFLARYSELCVAAAVYRRSNAILSYNTSNATSSDDLHNLQIVRDVVSDSESNLPFDSDPSFNFETQLSIMKQSYPDNWENSSSLLNVVQKRDEEEVAEEINNSPSVDKMSSFLKFSSVEMTLLKWEQSDSEKLGQGNFASVYRCVYNKEQCAIKHVKNVMALSDRELRSIKREAAIMNAVRHTNIITFVASDIEQGIIITEMACCSLHDLLHKTVSYEMSTDPDSKLREKVKWLIEIASALRYLHAHGIIHRDIKPANVLLVEDANGLIAKVCDFGISSAVGMTTLSTSNASSAMGTAPYMAPELFDFEGIPVYSSAVDVFSFGVVTNELMSESVPWRKLTFYQISIKLSQGHRATPFVASCESEKRMLALIGDSSEGCLATVPNIRLEFAAIVRELRNIELVSAINVTICDKVEKNVSLESAPSDVVLDSVSDPLEPSSICDDVVGHWPAKITSDPPNYTQSDLSANGDVAEDNNSIPLDIVPVSDIETSDHPINNTHDFRAICNFRYFLLSMFVILISVQWKLSNVNVIYDKKSSDEFSTPVASVIVSTSIISSNLQQSYHQDGLHQKKILNKEDDEDEEEEEEEDNSKLEFVLHDDYNDVDSGVLSEDIEQSVNHFGVVDHHVDEESKSLVVNNDGTKIVNVTFDQFVNHTFHGSNSYTNSKGDNYIGEISNSMANGNGKMTYADGSVCMGQFLNDANHGQCNCTYANGDEYVGEFVNNLFHGQGTCTSYNYSVYVGEFKNHKKCGNGTVTFFGQYARQYVGEFLDDEFHGQGTYTSLEDGVYVGEFKNHMKCGNGTLTFFGQYAGHKYVGEFLDDEFHGQGTYTFPDGSIYVGKFQHDNTNGQGTITFTNGNTYIGEFVEDLFHGQGTYVYANKWIYVGKFQHGETNGLGKVNFIDGDMYVGEFVNDSFHGQGTYTYANGEVYKGEFKNGKKSGHGETTFADGIKHVGEYHNGVFHGLGSVTYPSGVVRVADFKNGE